MIAEFLSYLHELCIFMADYAMVVVYAHIVPEWYDVLTNFLIAGFIFGSAFLSATVAESRRHKMKLHFLLGLVAPYIYPLVLALRLKIAQEAVEEEEGIDELTITSNAMTARLRDIQEAQQKEHNQKLKRVRPETEYQREQKEKAAAQNIQLAEFAVDDDAPTEDGTVFDRRFFQGLAVDSSGAKAGPFKLILANGAEYHVNHITNIQKDLASFEIDVSGSIKNIRVKFDKIKSFNKI
jgi:hypothetical protein